MKKAVTVITVLILAGVGYIAYAKYQERRFIALLLPHIKNSSLRVANSAQHEIEDDSKITYKELFETREADIAEIDKRLLEVQTLSSAETASTTEPAVAYLRACQEYMRALLQKYRKQLARSSAMNRFTESLEGLSNSSSYTFEISKRLSDKATEDWSNAEKEYNESLPAVVQAVMKLQKARDRVKPFFPEDALVSTGQLETVAQKNSKKGVVLTGVPK